MAPDFEAGLASGAYVTIALLIGIAALLGWLIASYPGQPSQGAITDDCEAVAEQYNQSKGAGDGARNSSTAVKNNETTPQNSTTNQAQGEINTERQIAKYNCELAIYTRDLAYFTKWLVYATTGLIVIGLLQGYFLRRSVGVADRAATEARDAIKAAQTSADAAMRTAKTMENTAKRQLRAYVSADPDHIYSFDWNTPVCMRYFITKSRPNASLHDDRSPYRDPSLSTPRQLAVWHIFRSECY